MKNVTVDLTSCVFNKKFKSLELQINGYPSKITVISNRTNKAVDFVPVQPGDKWFDEDQWDGEMQVYKPTINLPTVEKLVVIWGN
jgi:hypothetical protein